MGTQTPELSKVVQPDAPYGTQAGSTLAPISILLSLIAAFLVFIVIAISIPLLFLAANSAPASMVAHYAVACLMSALGYLVIARSPIRIATASLCVRLVTAPLLLIPISTAIYVVFFGTDSSFIKGIGVFLLVATSWLFSASIWPAWLARANPSLQVPDLER